MVALGDELQHTFIYGTAHVEAEHRVKAVLHVGKILVREQLHQHSGHLGNSGLIIALVPHAAARPVGFPLGADVLDNLGREQIAVAARQLTRCAVGILAEFLAAAVGAIDEQRAHNLVVGGATSIGVQTERNIHRYLHLNMHADFAHYFALLLFPSLCQILYHIYKIFDHVQQMYLLLLLLVYLKKFLFCYYKNIYHFFEMMNYLLI